jgi:hypothetical protein
MRKKRGGKYVEENDNVEKRNVGRYHKGEKKMRKRREKGGKCERKSKKEEENFQPRE